MPQIQDHPNRLPVPVVRSNPISVASSARVPRRGTSSASMECLSRVHARQGHTSQQLVRLAAKRLPPGTTSTHLVPQNSYHANREPGKTWGASQGAKNLSRATTLRSRVQLSRPSAQREHTSRMGANLAALTRHQDSSLSRQDPLL